VPAHPSAPDTDTAQLATATAGTVESSASGATSASGSGRTATTGAAADAPGLLRITPSSLFRAIAVVAIVTLGAAILARAAGPVMWFVEAAVVAALAWPLVQRLGRHIPSWVAVLVLTAATLAVVSGLGAAMFTELHHETVRFRSSVPAAAQRLQDDEPFGGVLEDLKVAQQIDRMAKNLSERFSIGHDLPGIASAVGGKVSSGFVIWVLSVMLVFTGPGMVRATVRTLPDDAEARVGPALQRAYGDAVRYLGDTALRALGIGALVYVTATVLDIDMPVLLATVAMICAFIPYVGVMFAALPLALLAILNGTTEMALILVAALVLQTIDSLRLQPLIHRRSFQFGLFPTLVVTTIGYGLYGVTGLFLGLVFGTLGLALLQRLAGDGAGDGEGVVGVDVSAGAGPSVVP
jgi:predicted PurR-regulated permease PerM